MKCPNCTYQGDDLMAQEHADRGCLLVGLAVIVHDRGEVAIDRAKLADVDIDWFWSRLGPVVNDLEDRIGKPYPAAREGAEGA